MFRKCEGKKVKKVKIGAGHLNYTKQIGAGACHRLTWLTLLVVVDDDSVADAADEGAFVLGDTGAQGPQSFYGGYKELFEGHKYIYM